MKIKGMYSLKRKKNDKFAVFNTSENKEGCYAYISNQLKNKEK